MRTSKKNSSFTTISFLVMLLLAATGSAAAQAPTPPLVYNVENTGANFPRPVLPSVADLPIVRPLPDPFVFFDGSPRDISFASWERRRNEIKAEIEKYEIGPKPDKSDLTINAVYSPGSNGGVLTVDVLRLSNGRTLRLTSTINLPSGTPPAAGWPAIIRMALAPGTGANSLGIATIDYVHDDVTQYAAGQQISHAGDPYFLMYPEYDAGCNSVNYQPEGPCPAAPGRQLVGQYSAWAWGVSRLIDGMEIAKKQIVNPLPIDLKHLGVNGCSYAGKMALFAGAFDERIAATFAQESGGGGAPSWRVSEGIEPDGTVEKSSNTDGSWFINTMKTDFGHANTYKLPDDHHELMAMVAPRALMVSGNTDFVWLSNRSAYVTAKATQKIYETLGIGDRFGFWIDGSHGHCALGANEQPAIDAFYKKFLLGQEVNWDLHVYPQTSAFTDLDYQRWTWWWGHGNPRFPDEDTTPPVTQASTTPSPTSTGWNNSNVVVTLNATDPDDSAASSDVQQISISLSGAQTGSNVVQGNSAQVTVSAEGTTTISYFATDSAGNQESPVSLTVNVDKTPPAITITTPADGATYQANSSVVSSYSCSDSVSDVASCSGPVASGANIDTTSVGTHQFTVQVTDLAGNSSSLTHTYSVQPQAPNAVLTASPTSGRATLAVNFSGSGSSDPNPGGVITSYFFTFGDDSAPVEQNSPTITHTYTKKGTYTAWLIVRDNYGANSKATSVTVKLK